MIRLVLACLGGFIIGFFVPIGINIDWVFSLILPPLLFSVGLSLGNLNILKLEANRKFIMFPVFSFLGSLVFSLLLGIFMRGNIKEFVLTGSSMGFYSLPAIMVSTKLGVIAGTFLLVTNMLREAITILLAPLIVKLFGKYSIIAVGGATTMDVSLAMIKEVAGEEFVPVAILNGLILTLSVPFIISLFINL